MAELWITWRLTLKPHKLPSEALWHCGSWSRKPSDLLKWFPQFANRWQPCNFNLGIFAVTGLSLEINSQRPTAVLCQFQSSALNPCFLHLSCYVHFTFQFQKSSTQSALQLLASSTCHTHAYGSPYRQIFWSLNKIWCCSSLISYYHHHVKLTDKSHTWASLTPSSSCSRDLVSMLILPSEGGMLLSVWRLDRVCRCSWLRASSTCETAFVLRTISSRGIAVSSVTSLPPTVTDSSTAEQLSYTGQLRNCPFSGQPTNESVSDDTLRTIEEIELNWTELSFGHRCYTMSDRSNLSHLTHSRLAVQSPTNL